jgi:transcriptional regulator with XRE-family HTH domain
MTYSTSLINAVKASNNECSDYKVAQLLGVSRQLISNIRKGRRNLSEELTIKAAILSNEDPKIALIRKNKETENPEVRQYWEEIEQRIQ